MYDSYLRNDCNFGAKFHQTERADVYIVDDDSAATKDMNCYNENIALA